MVVLLSLFSAFTHAPADVSDFTSDQSVVNVSTAHFSHENTNAGQICPLLSFCSRLLCLQEVTHDTVDVMSVAHQGRAACSMGHEPQRVTDSFDVNYLLGVTGTAKHATDHLDRISILLIRHSSVRDNI